VNRASPLYTLTLTAPATSDGLSVTLSHPLLVFTPATIVFAPGQLTAQFSFTPIALPNSNYIYSSTVPQVNVVLSGAEASYYEYSQLYEVLNNFIIIPQLGFSPIPALFVDQGVEGLIVWLAQNLTTGFTYGAQSSFVLSVEAWTPVSEGSSAPAGQLNNVYFEPSTLEFTPESVASGASLSQSYSISHLRPHSFGSYNYYLLRWYLRFQGAYPYIGDNIPGFEITQFVPLDAQRVLLSRYQIEPQFPNVLNFHWQDAAFNLTRAPVAPLTLTPHQAVEDGQTWSAYGGQKTAGGRIVFDPAVISFGPGQAVSHFKVLAIAGSNQRQVYYRVQWEMEGFADDLSTYLDYVFYRSDGPYSELSTAGPAPSTQFATWHVAPAAHVTVSALLLLLAVLISVLA